MESYVRTGTKVKADGFWQVKCIEFLRDIKQPNFSWYKTTRVPFDDSFCAFQSFIPILEVNLSKIFLYDS